MELMLDTTLGLTGGRRARVRDVIIDPGTRRATHLVLAVADASPGARLVPLQAVRSDTGRLELGWSADRVLGEPAIEQIGPDAPAAGGGARCAGEHVDEGWDVGVITMRALAPGARGWGPARTARIAPGPVPAPRPRSRRAWTTVFDRVPRGSAELRRASLVVDSERRVVGRLEAIVLAADHAIVGIGVRRGLLGGRRRLTVPAGDVACLCTDRVDLRVRRADLSPAVSIRRQAPA